MQILISEPNAAGMHTLPYVWAILKSYWEHHGSDPGAFTWLDPIYERSSVTDSLERFGTQPPDVIGLSSYTWNWDLQCEIARWAKRQNPNCIVVAGGPDPDYKDREFFRKHGYIDAVVVKDGEIPFTSILETVLGGGRDFRHIPGLYLPQRSLALEGLLDAASPLHFTGPAQVPQVFDYSPYIEQSEFYERLVPALGPHLQLNVTWETNRGCPYGCSFCDWGSATMSKVRRFDMARLEAEADWFGRLGVEFVFIADANFGILPRDVEIADRLVAVRARYGHPRRLYYSSAKNNPERVVQIAQRTHAAGLTDQHILALQHTDAGVLAATERSNIPSAKYRAVVSRLIECGISSEVQLILGIPGDTSDKWKDCLAEIMDWGVHESYQVYPYSLLPNAPASEPQFQQKWRTDAVDRGLGLYGGTHMKSSPGITKSKIVVGSTTFSREDWVEMSTYTAFVKAYHNGALTRLPLMYLRYAHGVPYRELYDAVVDDFGRDSPVVSPLYRRVREVYDEFLLDQDASDQMDLDDFPHCAFVADPSKWLFVKLCQRLKEFYHALAGFLTARFPGAEHLRSAVEYQEQLVITPDCCPKELKSFPIDRDWPTFFREARALTEYRTLAEPAPFVLPRVAEIRAHEPPARAAFLNFDAGSPEERWNRWLNYTLLQQPNLSSEFTNFSQVEVRRRWMWQNPQSTRVTRTTRPAKSAS
jgi:putative methyltransferase